MPPPVLFESSRTNIRHRVLAIVNSPTAILDEQLGKRALHGTAVGFDDSLLGLVGEKFEPVHVGAQLHCPLSSTLVGWAAKRNCAHDFMDI